MPIEKRSLRVFLCHAHSDKEAVKALYTRLVRDGVDAWLDKENLLPGLEWEYEIRKAVRESNVVVVCLSKQFNRKGFRQKEVRIALEEAELLPKGEIYIIPARLEECEVLEDLKRWQWVDLFEPDGYGKLMRTLHILAEKMGVTLRAQRNFLASITAPRLASKKTAIAPKKVVDKNLMALDEKPVSNPQPNENRKLETKSKYNKLKPPVILAILGISSVFLVASLTIVPKLFNPLPYAIMTATEFPATNTLLHPVITPSVSDTPNAKITSTLTPTEQDTATVTVTPELIVTSTSTLDLSSLHIGSTITSSIDGMTMVYVPPGSYNIGNDYVTSGSTIHTIILDGFWIDQTDVTNAMYSKCVNLGVCEPPKLQSSYTRTSYFGNHAFDNYPVLYVDWNMAKSYCQWAGRRLPTEAEWIEASRGTKAQTYPWGEGNINISHANYNSNVGDTTTVRFYERGKSPYGAYDMAGNVWQWVADWYDAGYFQTLGQTAVNPQGPQSGIYRVLRGGSWEEYWNNLDPNARNYEDPSWNYATIGFRCSRSAP